MVFTLLTIYLSLTFAIQKQIQELLTDVHLRPSNRELPYYFSGGGVTHGPQEEWYPPTFIEHSAYQLEKLLIFFLGIQLLAPFFML